VPEPVVRDVPRVFLAHACKFDWFIHVTATQMDRRGIRAYVAEWDHQDGANVDTKAMKNLEASDGVVVAWTASGSTSERVIAEYRRAGELGIPIQLLLPKVGVDRPVDWGHREYVALDIRKIPFRIFPPTHNVVNGFQVWTRIQEFSFRCLKGANDRAARGAVPRP
jgi:hypothetical protein